MTHPHKDDPESFWERMRMIHGEEVGPIVGRTDPARNARKFWTFATRYGFNPNLSDEDNERIRRSAWDYVDRREVTLNENCRHMEDYPAKIISFEPPHFFHVKPFGCAQTLRLTPGHFKEEDQIVKDYNL